MARGTVYEGVKVEKNRRNPASIFDRLKILLILGVFFLLAVTYQPSPPFTGWSEALEITLGTVVGFTLFVLMGLEVLRQFHYYISEKSAGYNHIWSNSVFGGGMGRTRPRAR